MTSRDPLEQCVLRLIYKNLPRNFKFITKPLGKLNRPNFIHLARGNEPEVPLCKDDIRETMTIIRKHKLNLGSGYLQIAREEYGDKEFIYCSQCAVIADSKDGDKANDSPFSGHFSAGVNTPYLL